MKPLKRYQYERYAVLCNLAYPRVFRQTRYGFDPNGQHIIRNQFGKIMIRVLWSKNQEEAVVVIKGSHSVSDWLLNFAMWTRSCQHLGLDYRIHAGFYHLLHQESLPTRNEDKLGLSVLQRLEAVVVPLIESGKRIVTFGQPAIGNWRFRQRYSLSHKTYRICCDLDIVTFMPPIPLIYWHVGKLLWLYNGRIYENTPTFIRLGRSLLSWLVRPFSYHLMSKYIRNKDFFDER
ncbi:lipase family protein [Vibrio anguillarum]|uniref:lipase family protein n=1 Tax=Vibrio anguillarum TaxID=55601 RepID=UPI000BB4A1D8|nr:lipase [Vibrio anguillarum]ATC59640.1 lipase [Vibrio anguillarum]MBF4250177.1 lipase [Vibrio anguillarum]MBF4388319.1 lipase [Vibrio anguillarum]MBF4403657.1 lipase [Vibrio anguillarum]